MNDDTPLSLATFQDLWETIKKRTVGALLVIETQEECASNETKTHVYYHGGINRSLGLAERSRGCILDDIIESTKRKDDDDE